MALIWSGQKNELRRRDTIDWVAVYVWCLIASSVIASLLISALVQ